MYCTPAAAAASTIMGWEEGGARAERVMIRIEWFCKAVMRKEGEV
jgi:hypothetical protein